MKKKVLEIIRNDKILRQEIAVAIGVTETTVYKYCFKNSRPLQHYHSVKAIMKSTGLKEHEIFLKKAA